MTRVIAHEKAMLESAKGQTWMQVFTGANGVSKWRLTELTSQRRMLILLIMCSGQQFCGNSLISTYSTCERANRLVKSHLPRFLPDRRCSGTLPSDYDSDVSEDCRHRRQLTDQLRCVDRHLCICRSHRQDRAAHSRLHSHDYHDGRSVAYRSPLLHQDRRCVDGIGESTFKDTSLTRSSRLSASGSRASPYTPNRTT